MLKNIPAIISPNLLKILAEMGHGDEIVIADGNFPSESVGQRVVRADGSDGKAILDAVLKLIPLDVNENGNSFVMAVDNNEFVPEIWGVYNKVMVKYEKDNVNTKELARQDFYDRAKKAYAVIATKEKALYANVILRKGCVKA